jgi:hypothetical protein
MGLVGGICIWEHPPLQHEPVARLVGFEGGDELSAEFPILSIFSLRTCILASHRGYVGMIAGVLIPSGLRTPAQHLLFGHLWFRHPTLLINLLVLKLFDVFVAKCEGWILMMVLVATSSALAENYPRKFGQ